jgi:glycogen debranching enzyme
MHHPAASADRGRVAWNSLTDIDRYAGTIPPPSSLGRTDGSVTLVEGQTFCLSDRTGDVCPSQPHGLFVLDTRVLSRWELLIDGHPLEPLTVDVPEPFTALFVGRALPSAGQVDSDVIAFRDRAIGQGLRERIAVTNYGTSAVDVEIELRCDVDFADLFEVKERRVVERVGRRHEPTAHGLLFAYRDANVDKTVELRTHDAPAVIDDTLRWMTKLGPHETWTVCVECIATLGDEVLVPRFRCRGVDTDSLPARRLASWRASLPAVQTDHAGLGEAVRQAGDDLGALRIFDPEHPDVPILAAGAPWFMTVFGRDSLLAAWMTLLAEPALARGVLETLARFQGVEVNAETEEEPGKILHEMRFGASARAALGSGEVYYGSIDATPLFVMLLGELRRWDLADDCVPGLLPHADRALEWIEHFGDRDGDGYVEYARASPTGLANQGWKDSWDAIRFADGRLAEAPIALCEVQGYVYAAYVARAHFAREAGDEVTFVRYRDKARELWLRFNEDFWLPDLGYYALGLDGEKRPIDALASNLGHCLWTGIIDPARAGLVVERLMSPEMFSGWGVRTLATTMAAFNPVSYHNGSIWPHDNAICAAGLMRYGYVEEAHRVIGAQLDVSEAFRGHLPELFAGFARGRPASPASYPTSCSPQAWASASPLLWLRTLLRIDPWAAHDEVRIDPELPPWIQALRVEGIQIAGESLTVDVVNGRVDVRGGGHLDVLRNSRAALVAARVPGDF